MTIDDVLYFLSHEDDRVKDLINFHGGSAVSRSYYVGFLDGINYTRSFIYDCLDEDSDYDINVTEDLDATRDPADTNDLDFLSDI